MKVIILGSGVIGVTTAYLLASHGHEVVVLERQPSVAMECSFANGGQLSYSHAEPWASPHLLPKIPKWLIDKYSPLVFRLRWDTAMWSWLYQFLRQCTHEKMMAGTSRMLNLTLYSQKVMETIFHPLNLAFDYSHDNRGIIHIFKNAASLAANIAHAEFQKTLGCPFEILPSREACEEKEPAFRFSSKSIIGGIFYPLDASGNVNTFSQTLAALAREKGATFHFNTHITAIEHKSHAIQSILTDQGTFSGDTYVVCLGAYSPLPLRPLGIKLPVYPMKGYSISIPIQDGTKAPRIGVTDQGNKVVYSRLGNILRLAGTAEFAGYDHRIDPQRIAALKKMIQCLFPQAGDLTRATEWACLRPSTPDGLPVLGHTPFSNLILNTGHGTLGWTLACGSAKITTDIVEGKSPDISLDGLTLQRFL